MTVPVPSSNGASHLGEAGANGAAQTASTSLSGVTSKLAQLGKTAATAAGSVAAIAGGVTAQPKLTSQEVVHLEHEHGAHK